MRVGVLAYINSLPVTWGLESGQVGPGTQILSEPPRELNRMTQEGSLDITPVSSIQWLHCHQCYRAVPGLALSSRGPVQSVKLFSRAPVDQLAGQRVAVTGASATSRVLLQILIPGLIPVPLEGAPALSAALPACLLIGDQALLEAPEADYSLDLGQAWFERTGLPMVFALWLVRRDRSSSQASELLGASQSWGDAHRDEVLAEAGRRTGLSRERLDDYYRGLYFSVGEAEQRGLFEYYRQAAELGLAPACPDNLRTEFGTPAGLAAPR